MITFSVEVRERMERSAVEMALGQMLVWPGPGKQ